MNRTTAREIAVQLLYSGSFDNVNLDEFFTEENFKNLSLDCEFYNSKPGSKQTDYIRSVLDNYRCNAEEVDGIISRFSEKRAINRIPRTALAVLRCAITEILYIDDVPVGAAIDSAVEIDKGYDEEETVSFVNGVLGSFARELAGE